MAYHWWRAETWYLVGGESNDGLDKIGTALPGIFVTNGWKEQSLNPLISSRLSKN